MTRVADFIMERLLAANVTHLFAVTGRGCLFLSDAAARLKSLTCISTHHEQAAAYAAVAYAQYTGTLGACLVSTGCAMTNAVSGVLTAWQDGIPCVFVSGQNTLQETTRFSGIPLRTYGQQEADIVRIVESITKCAVMISDPKRVAFELDRALFLAESGRKGPVWIDVPLDVQSMRIEPGELERFIPTRPAAPTTRTEDIDYLATAIGESVRPVLLIGSGVRSAGAIGELEAFLASCRIPVTYTGSAADVYGTAHALSIGSVGTMGCSRAGNFAVQNADLVIVLGNRLSSMTTGTEYHKFARAAKVVVVDVDPIEHSKKTIRIDRLIVADVKEVLSALPQRALPAAFDAWREKCAHWKSIFPICEPRHRDAAKVDLYLLAEVLSNVLPDDAVFLSDSGLAEIILPSNMTFRKGMRCIHPASQGAMGFALPAAVGASYASGRDAVAVVGDGSIMMNLQELQTIRYYNVPVKILVISNNVYAIIRKRQKDLFRSRTIGTDPSNGVACPSFRKVAEGFEIPYVLIENSAGLEEGLKAVLAMEGPVICEILGLEDQGYLETSHARNAERRFVRRPLEDQAPFLEREVFLSEMIIDPIDQ